MSARAREDPLTVSMRALAIASSSHPRIGEHSPMRLLSNDLLTQIADCVIREYPMQPAPHPGHIYPAPPYYEQLAVYGQELPPSCVRLQIVLLHTYLYGDVVVWEGFLPRGGSVMYVRRPSPLHMRAESVHVSEGYGRYRLRIRSTVYEEHKDDHSEVVNTAQPLPLGAANAVRYRADYMQAIEVRAWREPEPELPQSDEPELPQSDDEARDGYW